MNKVSNRMLQFPPAVKQKLENELNLSKIKKLEMLSDKSYSKVFKISIPEPEGEKIYAMKEICKGYIEEKKIVSQIQQEVNNMYQIKNTSNIIKIQTHFED